MAIFLKSPMLPVLKAMLPTAQKKQDKQKNSPAPYKKSNVPVAEAILMEEWRPKVCAEKEEAIQCSPSQKGSLKVRRRKGSRSTGFPKVSRLPQLSW
jgi:hypothetical protein